MSTTKKMSVTGFVDNSVTYWNTSN